MVEQLRNILPNVIDKTDLLGRATLETAEMVLKAGGVSLVLGLVLGMILTVTSKGGISENKLIYQISDKAVNLLRAVPFIILMMCLVPLTRIVAGTSIGVKGAILPLVFGTVPFLARQVEAALADTDRGLIEAGKSMGLSKWEIMISIYIRESIPGLTRVATITITSLIGLTTMAGAIGAGGLGNFAIMYGHQRNMPDIVYTTVLILLIMVTVVQVLGNYIASKYTH